MQESSQDLKDIEVNVDFYDESEKAKLMQYPTATTMDKLVPGRLRIPTAEFLTYYFFHNIKLGIEGYRDFDSVSKRVYLHLNSIRQYFNFEDGSIRNRGTNGQEKGVTEHIGEAIGLSVINRFHGMTKADWKPIYEGKIKTFDYQLASDGKNFVQLEAKGSSGNNNRLKTSAVSKQKRRIADKKSSLNLISKFGKDPHPASIRYGTITVIDNRSDSIVRCLITDPPSKAIEEDPKSFRLIARMSFLHNWISFISPRSAIATALATRIADLEALKNPYELDGIPLMRANREPFDYSKFGGYRKTSFMASKSHVPDGPAGGIVVQISNDELFFWASERNY